MTDPFRGGGFGSIGFGPYQTSGGGDSRYLIANDGDNVALSKKYAAQIQWANGTITDEAYLGALAAYVRTTDSGSRDRISAQNEYDDAVYTIGRNRIVRAVNNASSSTLRVAALRRLVAYDRRKLGTMTKDNEKARELIDRIADAESQVREVRYSDLVRRFNAKQVSLETMLSYARNAAAGSTGGPDHDTWLDRVREWGDRVSDEKLNQLYQDYEHDRIPGTAITDFLKGRLATMDPSSPSYKDTARTIEDLTKQFTEKDRAKKDADMQSQVQNGTISRAAYLRYLHQRTQDYPKGSAERRSAEDAWLQTSFQFGEDDLRTRLASGDATPKDAVDFYHTYMATMEPTSARYLQLQQQLTSLLISGTQDINLFGTDVGGYGPGGHWVSLSGAPGGTPVNGQGFASQFDGSAFANTNCGMASAAMLAWAASGGRVKVSGGDLRYYSGDRDQTGDERGTTFDDIAIAFQQVGLGLKQYHGLGFDAWKRRLLAGEGSLISGSYADAPANLRLSDFQGNHTMYVDRARKVNGKVWFFVMDPLGRAGYNGRWWPEEAIRAYGWSNRVNGIGQWNGDVAFATRRGRSATFIRPDREQPRFQAFDTDAEGRSTVGRGGGTSRAEAGPRRDWSKGRANEKRTVWPGAEVPTTQPSTGGDGTSAPRPGIDATPGSPDERGAPVSRAPVAQAGRASTITDDQVTEFLAAVDAVGRPSLSNPADWGAADRTGERQGGTPDARRARARAILGEWGGDARMAAAAWFTGDATNDTTRWTQTQRFYANAVATRLGYQPVPRGGLPQSASTLTPMPAPNPPDLVTTGPRSSFDQADADLTKASPDAARLSKALLQELGVEPTPDMVRAVAAWITTGSPTVKGNNPLLLHTQGQQDLIGQVAKDASGVAIFDTPEAGIKAAAAEIAASAPGIIAAARSGDPERFLVAVDRSGWTEGGYGGALIRTFNELPGGRRIIGGMPGLLKGATDLRDLSRSVPAIAELFDIDPRDPAQMAWLDLNVENAKTALARGDDQWTFVMPGGQEVPVDFSPSMASDITAAKASYLDWVAAIDPNDAAAQTRASTAWKDHNRLVANVTGDGWKAQMESLDRLRQASLAGGDYATYINATFEMEDATKAILGLPADAVLDPSLASSQTIGDLREYGLLDKVIAWGDKLDVRDASGDLRSFNPSGDPVLELLAKGYITAQRDRSGNVVAVSVDPSVAYVGWEDDGTVRLHTIETDKADFMDADVPLAPIQGGSTFVPRRYMQEQVAVTIDGRTAYAKQSTGTVQAAVVTSSGYREATVVAPDGNPLQRQFLVGPGRGIGFQNAIVNQFPMNGTPVQGVLRPHLLNVVTPQDQMVQTVSASVPVSVVSVMDPRTHRLQTWYSIPGSNQWLGGLADSSTANPPRLVFSKGVTVINGEVHIGGASGDVVKPEDLGRYVHWYGTDPGDGAAPGEVGAPNTHWRLRQGLPTVGGGVAIDTAPPDQTTAFLEGDIPVMDLIGSGAGRFHHGPVPQQPSRFSKDDVVPRNPAAAPSTDTALRQATGVAPDFSRISSDLAAAGLFDRLPMNAGAGPQAPVVDRPSAMTTFSARLVAGVRQSAAYTLQIAHQQQLAAQTQAAFDARMRAQEAQPTPAPTPRPTPAPTPTPTPAPRPSASMPKATPTPTPSPTQTPRPTPAPPPANTGTTRKGPGGVYRS